MSTDEQQLQKLLKKQDTRKLFTYLRENPKLHYKAIRSLKQQDNPSIDFLIDLLRFDDARWQGNIAERIWKLGDKRAVPPLISMLETLENDTLFACHIIMTLAQLGDERATDVLIASTQPKYDQWVRKAATEALGSIGNPDAIEPLKILLNDPHRQVQVAAQQALARLDKTYTPPESKIEPDDGYEPRLAYWGRDPWKLVLGSDGIRFAQYANGLTLCAHHDSPTGYFAVQLSEEEQQQFWKTIPFDALEKEQGFFPDWGISDIPEYYFLLWADEIVKQVTIQAGTPEKTQMPVAFHQLYHTITTYHHPRAKAWQPEKIEVVVWLWGNPNAEGIPWDANFPDLYYPDTLHRGTVYSLYVDAKHFDTIKQICASNKPIVMNGHTWAIQYRFALPSENYMRKQHKFMMPSIKEMLQSQNGTSPDVADGS